MEKIEIVAEQNRNCFGVPEEYNARKVLEKLVERIDWAESELSGLEEERDKEFKSEMNLIDEDESLKQWNDEEKVIKSEIRKALRRRNRDELRIFELHNLLEINRINQINYRANRERNARWDYENQTIEIQELQNCLRILYNRLTELYEIMRTSDAEWSVLEILDNRALLRAMEQTPFRVIMVSNDPLKIRNLIPSLRQRVPPPMEVTITFDNNHYEHVGPFTAKMIHADMIVGCGYTVNDVEVPASEVSFENRRISLILSTESLNVRVVMIARGLINNATIFKLQISTNPNRLLARFVSDQMIEELVLTNSCCIPRDLEFPTLLSLTAAEYKDISAENLHFLHQNKNLEKLDLKLFSDEQEQEIEEMIQEWVAGTRRIERWMLNKSAFLFISEEPVRRPNIDDKVLEVKFYVTVGKKILQMVSEHDL